MLNKYNNHVLFCYNYDDIYTEVTKRTSKLGQYRRTDALEHLLSQMAMTKDDEFMFMPYIKKACAEVFENIYPLSRGIDDAYRNNINSVTKTWSLLPDPSTIFYAGTSTITENPSASTHPANNRSLTISDTITANNPNWAMYSAVIVTRIWYDVYNSAGIERRYIEFTDNMTSGTTLQISHTGNIFVAENVQGLSLETYVGNPAVSYEYKLVRVSPTQYNAGEYITYNNNLYKVIHNTDENTDINDTRYFVLLTFDDRNAIIFEIHEKPWLDKNVFKITDNAVFECIVTFIMAEWFKVSKVDEATQMLAEYESNRINLRHRIQSSGVNHKLKSRYF